MSKLYVVATPIGNLKDITLRAIETLKAVHVIAAEDTRHSLKLLNYFEISAKLISCHEHNEEKAAQAIISSLQNDDDVAFVTDAGTPGLSDPGARLVKAVRKAGFTVTPIPGPSSIAAALSVAGISADRFHFEGFLPAKRSERLSRLQLLALVPEAMVFFEAPHRIQDSLADILNVFGDRPVSFMRELTKMHEEIICSSLSQLLETLSKNGIKGEIVFVLAGATTRHDACISNGYNDALADILTLALSEKKTSVKSASELLARISGLPKGKIYELALKITKKDEDTDQCVE